MKIAALAAFSVLALQMSGKNDIFNS